MILSKYKYFYNTHIEEILYGLIVGIYIKNSNKRLKNIFIQSKFNQVKKRDILDDIKMSSLIHVVERNSKPPAIYKVIKKGENKSSDDSGSR